MKPYTYIHTAIFCVIAILSSVCSNAQSVTCPKNLDFESGNLSNWQFFTGNCCPVNTTTGGPPVAGRHTLTTGTAVDPYGGFPIVPPGGGSFALKLGNSNVGAEAERARYYVRVPSGPQSIYTLLYRYAVVFQDPSHPTNEQPRFEVNVFDSATGQPLPCNQFTFVASSNLPGFKSAGGGVWYKDWSTSSIDLSAMAGKTVAVDFTASDCGYGGHFGYAYIDVSCGIFGNHKFHCTSSPTLNLTAPPGFQTYDWYDSTTLAIVGTGQNLSIPTPSTNKTYMVVLTPYVGFGCPDTLFTHFTLTSMSVNTISDTGICKGDSVYLSTQITSTYPPSKYEWIPTTGLSCSNCSSTYAKPQTTTTYFITAYDSTGCSNLDSVTIYVNDNVKADIMVQGDSFCTYDKVYIENKKPSPLGPDYAWNLQIDEGEILSGQGSSEIVGKWHTDGLKTLTLKVTNGSYCFSTDTAQLYIKYTPLAAFEINTDVCYGDIVKLIPYKQEGSYRWTIDDHNITDTTYQKEINLKWETLGPKKVALEVDALNGCKTSKDTIIHVYEYPPADIKTSDITNLCIGKTFTLSTPEGNRLIYEWTPPLLFLDNNEPEVDAKANQTGFYHLKVTNKEGCSTLDSVYIKTRPCCEIFVPTAFTPNADGHNDVFKPMGLEYHKLVRFMIANRWGQVVFDTESNTTAKWDGKYKGVIQDIETYSYYIKYICEDKEVIERKGNFILLK